MSVFLPTSILVGWLLGIEYYGFSVIVLWCVIFGVLCIIDTLLWYTFARSKRIISSKTWQEWLTIKGTQFLLLAIFVILLGHWAYATDSVWLDGATSIVTMIACLGFCWGQLLSILENLAMMTHGSEQRVLTVVIRFLTKAFGIGEQAIEKKLDRYKIE